MLISLRRAEKKLDELIKSNADGLLLLLAQVGAQGVGGFQLDVSADSFPLEVTRAFHLMTRLTTGEGCRFALPGVLRW